MPNNIEGVIKCPETKRRKVWIGGYGGHYNAIVIFHKKPIKSKEESNFSVNNIWYDCFDNKERIAGCCDPEQFEEMFGVDISSCIESIEITKLIEMNLTAWWDGDRLKNIAFDMDGW